MAVPKTKSNDLIQTLYPSLCTGELLISEVELYGVMRDAKKLPIDYQAYSIEGLCLMLKGKFDEGCDLCERAIMLAPENTTTWINYAILLNNLDKPQKMNSLLHRAVRIRDFEILKQCIVHAAFWVDYELLKEAKMISQSDERLTDDIKSAIKTYDVLSQDESLALDLQKTAKIVMAIAEDEKLRASSSFVEDDGEGTVSYNLCVKVDSGSELSRLNDRIIKEMVAAGLEMTNCVAFFEPEVA
jgi:tetratricopeptide (TPR) repeat protein